MTTTRLYTWVDVEQVFRERAEAGAWPEELIEAEAWWDKVLLSVGENEDQGVLLDWLADAFGPLWEPEASALRLESGDRLVVHLNETLGEPPTRRPRLRSRTVSSSLSGPLSHPAQELEGPPVVAFHSFKGGVGRTLHALAVSRVLSESSPVLLVDADLEAPGISWILRDRQPDPLVSFSDLLAMVHGSDDGEDEPLVSLIADRLENQLIDGIYVLPAARTGRPGTSAVTPADIVDGGRDPYRLTRILAALGRRLGAAAVVIDLRAGFSELSAGLLLDPRVHRVFVSSLSYQALEGTQALITAVCSDAPSTRDDDPLPAAILSLVPEGVDPSAAVDRLAGALQSVGLEGGALNDEPFDIPMVVSPLRQEWIVLPGTWDGVLHQISAPSVAELVDPIIDWIAPHRPTDEDEVAAGHDIADVRQRLSAEADRLKFAETAVDPEASTAFMPTDALSRLASDHSTEVPATVVVGAKGAGKTFTFLNLALASTWETFAEAATGSVAGAHRFQAAVIPSLGPKNVGISVERRLIKARSDAPGQYGGAAPSTNELHELIEDAIARPPQGSAGWRRFWLDLMLVTLGRSTHPDSAEAEVQRLATTGERRIFVFDGLEEAFIGFSTEPTQQDAIRSLVQDIPRWLQLLEGRPLGVVVFVREDIVRAALPQNSGQLLQQHRAYALRWNDDEVLRLALWTASRAAALEGWNPADVRAKSAKEVEAALVKLWGRKMGSARSREARSTQWVIAALSDFRPQVQARDLVGFLSEAATRSVADAGADRILTPQAMRLALLQCSRDKLAAIEEEDPRLATVFAALRGQELEMRKTPFDPADIGLDTAAVDLLESTGAAMRMDDLYWLPEIYRQGLGYENNASRPRVIQLANRARR